MVRERQEKLQWGNELEHIVSMHKILKNKKKIISAPQREGKRIPFLIIKCSCLVKAFRNPCLLIRLLHLLLGRASMEGEGEKEEEGEGKELHRLHKGTWDGNQVVKKSSSNKPQARTVKGLRACAAPKHREHVLTYLEETLLQKL